MDVKMHSIMAGPDGCADAGEVVTLSATAAKRLIKGNFAAEVAAPVRETTMVDPRQQEKLDADRAAERAKQEAEREAESKTAESVGLALDALDPTEDDDWTASGKPAMDRVKDLTGSASITRAELDALYPDFTRAGPAEGDAGKAAPPASAGNAPASGARTNGL